MRADVLFNLPPEERTVKKLFARIFAGGLRNNALLPVATQAEGLKRSEGACFRPKAGAHSFLFLNEKTGWMLQVQFLITTEGKRRVPTLSMQKEGNCHLFNIAGATVRIRTSETESSSVSAALSVWEIEVLSVHEHLERLSGAYTWDQERKFEGRSYGTLVLDPMVQVNILAFKQR